MKPLSKIETFASAAGTNVPLIHAVPVVTATSYPLPSARAAPDIPSRFATVAR
jgi:hypothetical protein